MRTFGLSLSGLLFSGTVLLAQPTAPARPQAPAGPAMPPPTAPLQLNPNDPIDNLLLQWERAMKQIRFMTTECTRRDTDRVSGTTRDWTGSAAYLAPNLVRLYLANPKNKESWEYYLLNRNALYEYKSDSKTVYVRQLPPPPPGQVANDTHFSLLFGMKATEAKRRYKFQLVKQDQHYFYLIVLPLWPQDKAEFTQARLVLYRANFLPRQVWFQDPNQNETLWELPRLDLSTPVKADDFVKPAIPQGWKERLVPLNQGAASSAPTPRVVRPQR